MKNFFLALLFMAIGALVMDKVFASDSVERYRNVIVPVERIIEREPDTVRTFVDRIITVEAEPIQVATAPGGAERDVENFCSPIINERVDTVYQPVTDTLFLFRSVSYDRRWAWRKDRLLLTGPLNTGDLRAIDYEVRGDYTVRASGGTALVQYPRTSLVYDVWEGGTQVYAAYKLGEFLVGLLK